MMFLLTKIGKSFFIFCYFIVSFFIFSQIVLAEDYYWVGNEGAVVNNINSWATSTAGVAGAGIPGSSDMAIFDNGTTTNAIIDADWSVEGININSGYTGTITQNVNINVTIGNSNFIQADGIYLATTGTFINNGSFEMSGGSFTPPSDSFSVFGDLTISTGTLDASSTHFILNGLDQNISLDATTTFASLIKSTTTATTTLTFDLINNLIITGTTTLQGTSSSMLFLRSQTDDVQWNFQPNGPRIFSFLDIKDSNNASPTEIDSMEYSNLFDSGNNTGWIFPTIISSQGRQTATTTIPLEEVYSGGAFTFIRPSGIATVTSIVITQNGTVSADTYLTNLRLYYQASSTCNSNLPEEVIEFGIGSDFVNNVSTTTGEMLVGPNNVCMYMVYDTIGTSTEALAGHTIDLQIQNPSTDILISTGTVIPNTPINISKYTILVNSLVTNILSLKMKDLDKNPTVFYLKDNSVWQREGIHNPFRLNNPSLLVQSLSFTDVSGVGNSKAVKIQILISNMDPGNDSTFLNVTRTFGTTATVRAGGQNE